MIVTLTTAVSIFVAADTRATVQGPDGQLHVQAGVFQKVDIAGKNSIIAVSGLFGIRTGLPALDWQSMGSLRDAATGLSGTFDAQFEDLSRRYKDSTSQAISRLPRRLEGLTPSSRPIINIYFARRSLGQSYLAAQHFELVSKQKEFGGAWDNTVTTVKTERVLDGGPDSRKRIAREKAVITASAPAYCPIRAEPREAHVYFLQGKFVEWMRRIINKTAAQSARCSDAIGGPIHIAVVDDRGARWAAPP
jgi:hypothetical protein